MVNDLFGRVPQKRGRESGTSNGAKHNDPRLEMFGKIRDNFFRQTFFYMRNFSSMLNFWRSAFIASKCWPLMASLYTLGSNSGSSMAILIGVTG